MERGKTEEAERTADRLDRAVDRFAAAVEEFARQVGRVSPPEPLSEEEAAKLAHEAVYEARAELWKDRKPERPSPTPEEVREWVERREERRRSEGYRPL